MHPRAPGLPWALEMAPEVRDVVDDLGRHIRGRHGLFARSRGPHDHDPEARRAPHGPESSRRRVGATVTGRIALALALLLLAGCATLTPTQEESLAEVRALTNETARAYGRPPIHLLVSHNPQAAPGSYSGGFFSVSALSLTSPFRDAIVAHELAHYVLGHEAPLRGSTTVERERDYQQRELDANAKAVEILTRVAGMSEVRALRTMYTYLAGVQWARERYPRLDLRGHKPPCEEIGDLLSRFPAQRAWTASLECAPPGLSAGG